MNYAESEAAIRKLRYCHGEAMFRMAVSHLMDVGVRNLTDEAVESTCVEIMQEDDSRSFMTNEFKCELIRLAGKLAKIDHIHLLVYISRNVAYDVGDNKLPYDRLDELLRYSVDHLVAVSYDPYKVLCSGCEFDDSDLEALGLERLIPEAD